MSALSLPIRIRPNRVRLLLGMCFSIAAAIAMVLLFADAWSAIAAAFLSPALSMEFAAAVLACMVVAAYCLLTAGFAAASLPGAPFFHIEIDEHFVTERFFGHVRRKFLRDVDGWTVQEHRRRIVRHGFAFAVHRWYTVVARPQGLDARRVDKATGELLAFDTHLFAPLFNDNSNFAEAFADCLSSAGKETRQSRRPVVVDVSSALASQTFELRPRAPAKGRPGETQSTRKRKRNQKSSRLPGRFPTNENMAAYWRDTATQAAKACDDCPESAHAGERAYFYGELAKRDRKRIARERREQRLRKQGKGSADVKTTS